MNPSTEHLEHAGESFNDLPYFFLARDVDATSEEGDARPLRVATLFQGIGDSRHGWTALCLFTDPARAQRFVHGDAAWSCAVVDTLEELIEALEGAGEDVCFITLDPLPLDPSAGPDAVVTGADFWSLHVVLPVLRARLDSYSVNPI